MSRPRNAEIKPFVRNDERAVVLWTGTPDCQAGHEGILAWLQDRVVSFVANQEECTQNIKGNIGEAISFCVALWGELGHSNVFPANALNPLSRKSRDGVDIVWLAFGEIAEQDLLMLQEVKTTGDSSLTYADNLLVDYDKLFDTDINFTLQSRVQEIKNRLELQYRVDRAIITRTTSLAGASPNTSPRVRLIPTIVHERARADPVTKMMAIRTTLASRGWSAEAIEPWAIGLTELNERIIRLSMGTA